jgi:hypothetical protein
MGGFGVHVVEAAVANARAQAAVEEDYLNANAGRVSSKMLAASSRLEAAGLTRTLGERTVVGTEGVGDATAWSLDEVDEVIGMLSDDNLFYDPRSPTKPSAANWDAAGPAESTAVGDDVAPADEGVAAAGEVHRYALKPLPWQVQERTTGAYSSPLKQLHRSHTLVGGSI